MSDPYHCRCFFIKEIEDFKDILLDFGFKGRGAFW